MSNYQKYYMVNKKKATPNKCLLKLPLNAGATSRWGWGLPFGEVLFSYLNSIWFTKRGAEENILYKYIKSIIDHNKFDFNGYKSVGNSELYKNPFKEIKQTHEACTVNIYAERIYTDFCSTVLDYHGTHLSLLATILNHKDFLKSFKYSNNNGMHYYNRPGSLEPKQLKNFNEFVELMLKCEKVTQEDTALVLDAYTNFINHVKGQQIYSPDEMLTSYRDKSFISNIFSLYLEFFIYTNDEKHIYELLQVYHDVGNTKAKTFNKYLKKKDDEKDTFTERPIGKYLSHTVVGNTKNPLDELYYFINFYKNYNNGKFLNKVVNEQSLNAYIMGFKTAAAMKQTLKKEYYTLFNSIKEEDTYSLETFEQMNMLVSSNLDNAKSLDILEQNFAMLELCLSNDVYANRWSSDTYNLFSHIEYKELNECQQSRYWKMVANFVNTTKFKTPKIKSILSAIARLLSMTSNEIITKLQPHIINIKQSILLEMYLE